MMRSGLACEAGESDLGWGRGGEKVCQKVWVRSGCAELSCVRGRQRMGRWVGRELMSGARRGLCVLRSWEEMIGGACRREML